MAIIGISGKLSSGKDTVGVIIQFLITNSIRVKRGAAPVSWTAYTDPKNIGVVNSRNWDESGWEIKKFAYKLKQMVSLMIGIPINDLEKEEVKHSVLGSDWGYNSILGLSTFGNGQMTVRELLQKFGTNAVRNHVHENAWVNALFVDYKDASSLTGNNCFRVDVVGEAVGEFPNWLITDVRFPNEYKAIENRGGLNIRVNRPDPNCRMCLECGKTEREQSQGCTEITCYKGRPKDSHPSETALDNYKFNYTIDNNGTLEDLIEKVRGVLKDHKIL